MALLSLVHVIRNVLLGLPIFLMLFVATTQAKTCFNRIDIAICIDITASRTPAEFAEVKGVAKDIAASFKFDKAKNAQLALIELSQTPKVAANFASLNSLSDFNLAVDKLKQTTGTANIGVALQQAKDNVFSTSRDVKASKRVLIIVKDRRSNDYTMPAAMLTQTATQATALKATKVAIHAVGVHGLWNTKELHALYGNGYLLFKDKTEAMSSLKSLDNTICTVCKPSTKIKNGICHNSARHVIVSKTRLVDEGSRASCRREITRYFEKCDTAGKPCNTAERKVGRCDSSGKATIVDTWYTFRNRFQSCLSEETKKNVDCVDANNCPGQIADIIFILDVSTSMMGNFDKVKKATVRLIRALNVGQKNVHVGIVTFGRWSKKVLKLDELTDKDAIIKKVMDLPKIKMMQSTYTHLGFKAARELFAAGGRKDVLKYFFIITDGISSDESKKSTYEELEKIKSAGITLYAIGIDTSTSKEENAQFKQELNNMAAPLIDTHKFILTEFKAFESWAKAFSKNLCVQLSPPHPQLCKEKASKTYATSCQFKKQLMMKTKYEFDSKNQCIKVSSVKKVEPCKKKCTDATVGNDYLENDEWTSLCHEFKCTKSSTVPLHPVKSSCMAADGTCKAVGATGFDCLDANGKNFKNCQCIKKDGKVTMVIDE